MIGGMGFTNCFREWQLALTISSTASTWSSSTPTRIVAFPCLRNPPDEFTRVARYSFSSSASTSVAASSLCTMAVTSFIGGRLLRSALARREMAEANYGAGEHPRATRHAPHAVSVTRGIERIPRGCEPDRYIGEIQPGPGFRRHPSDVSTDGRPIDAVVNQRAIESPDPGAPPTVDSGENGTAIERP